MKKVILSAAFAVLGFAVVSCSTDDIGVEKANPKVKEIGSNDASLFLKTGDSLGDGPGDDPIVVPPPPPPKP